MKNFNLESIGFEYCPSNNGIERWRKTIYNTNQIWVYSNGRVLYEPFVGLDEQFLDILEHHTFSGTSVCICYNSNNNVKYCTEFWDICMNGYRDGCNSHIQIDYVEFQLVKSKTRQIKTLLCKN